MAVIHVGKKIVWGVPAEIKPVIDPPEGKARFRFRAGSAGSAFYRTPSGITKYILLDNGKTWELFPQSKNHRP